MKPRGLIVMTALVPTIGHQFVIQFGADIMKQVDGTLYVIVCDRSIEPIKGSQRASAIREQFAHAPHVVVVSLSDDEAPQNDDGTQGFWDYWCNMARTATGQDGFEYVMASEAYGANYAKAFGATWIPCDIDREIYDVKGTKVRRNIIAQFDNVMPAFKQHLVRRVTFFGAESTGKTTATRAFAKDFGSSDAAVYLPEWARPYLERFGSEVTDARMDAITLAQYASQKAVVHSLRSPIVYQDTDLLSTIGYYRVYGGHSHFDINKMFRETKSDIYIVMNSKIPYEPDILRYGIDHRETTDQFWIDLLDEYGCHYYVVQETEKYRQYEEITKVLDQFVHTTYGAIRDFERD